ncbi:hypothetical protein [Nocardiopsis ganjiahuensis]|uniref:hypothetical protein n=1 Tax=Nocardiopsis ganjiahuensis TaxID=239984 RepID=UPI00037DA73C|nr:hypothetical protein [Nocardiopsis ganjiahuensis]
MSPVQIVRTVAVALIAGGVALGLVPGGTLGLVPGGTCGAGWQSSPSGAASFGWFAYEETFSMTESSCQTAMAPVGSWAIALIVIGAALLAGAWLTTPNRPKAEPTQ